MEPTPEQLLEGAADRIEQYGFVKGQYGRKACGFCALGAIRDTAIDIEGETGDYLIDLEYEAGEKLAAHIGSRVPEWNDDKKTTKEDVVRTLRKVAAA